MALFPSENRAWWRQTSIQAGDTVSGSTSEVIFASKPTVFTANSFRAGDIIRWNSSGTFGTVALNVATFSLRAKLGSTDIIAITGLSVGVLGLVAMPWKFSGELHIRSIGSSGTVEGDASAMLSLTSASQTVQILGTPSPVTINTTTDLQFQLSAQLSNLTAGNTITMRRFMVEKLI